MKLLSILFLLLTPLIQTVSAQSFVGEAGYVEFVSTAPLLEFKGTSDHLTGLIDFDDNLVDFYVDLNTIDTGVNLRNNHMRDSYLETEKFPFAEFTGSLNEMYDFEKSGKQQISTTGKFTIHGVEQEMQIDGTLQETDQGMMLEASWVVMLEDHDIRKPRVVFYELADEQTVNISILLKTQ